MSVANGSLTNQGTISGGTSVYVYNGSGNGGYGLVLSDGSVTNEGLITGGGGSRSSFTGSNGGDGATISGGGLTNTTLATIIGGSGGAGGSNGDNLGGVGGAGIVVTAGSVVNQGTIIGGDGATGVVYADGGDGIDLNGGVVSNQNAIVGGKGQGSVGPAASGGYGVKILAGTLINAGTIAGGIRIRSQSTTTADAVLFGGSARLILDPGASFTGAVAGNATFTDVLELASGGTGTIVGLGTSITNLASLVFDAGAQWTVAGNDSAGGLGTMGISGFAAGDTIDLTGFNAVSRTFASNSLVLTDSGNAHETLAIQGSFSTDNFLINPDGDGGTDITLPSVSPLVITGTDPGQTVNDNATAQPFSGVTINDGNIGHSDTVTITVTNGGSLTDADGTLSGTGLTKTGTGTYTLAGDMPAAVTTELDALIFTPTAHQVAPGGTITTGMTLSVSDGIIGSPTIDTATTVITTAANTVPTITGTAAGQTVTDITTLDPFAATNIIDPDFGASETVTIVLTEGGSATDADGTLSGTGLTKTGTGTYTLAAGMPSGVTTELDALIFTPTAHQIAPGGTITTGMTLSVTDGLVGSPTIDTATTVITTAVEIIPCFAAGTASPRPEARSPSNDFARATCC